MLETSRPELLGLVQKAVRAYTASAVLYSQDRRRVIIMPIPEEELPINASLETGGRRVKELLDGYSDEQLSVIYDFLSRSVSMTPDETANVREMTGRNVVAQDG
jgi:hypothetical protein